MSGIWICSPSIADVPARPELLHVSLHGVDVEPDPGREFHRGDGQGNGFRAFRPSPAERLLAELEQGGGDLHLRIAQHEELDLVFGVPQPADQLMQHPRSDSRISGEHVLERRLLEGEGRAVDERDGRRRSGRRPARARVRRTGRRAAPPAGCARVAPTFLMRRMRPSWSRYASNRRAPASNTTSPAAKRRPKRDRSRDCSSGPASVVMSARAKIAEIAADWGGLRPPVARKSVRGAAVSSIPAARAAPAHAPRAASPSRATRGAAASDSSRATSPDR